MSKFTRRLLGYPGRRQVRRLIADPPPVRKNSIVFTSTEDFSDNPRALYEYMIERGYNEKYEITWLFEFDENYRDLNTPNVKSVKMHDAFGQRSADSYRETLTAEYVFFSHNVNWAKNFRPEQKYIELWHGCGYKGRQPGESRVIQFDYCVTTGPKYARELTTHYLCSADKLKPLGYPRNDWFKTHKTQADRYAKGILSETGADKLVIWMPTFRKSRVARISTDTGAADLGLPLIDSQDDLRQLDEICRENNVVILVKTHVLDEDSALSYDGLANIRYADNRLLKQENVNLYELLACSDSLLTDYSSVAIDYLLLDRPIGFILSDFEEYDKVRGWCYDNVRDYMPGSHIYDFGQIEKYIRDVSAGNDRYTDQRAAVLPELQTISESYSRDILDYFGITL